MPFRGSQKTATTTSTPKWFGFQEVALTDVVDKSKDYDNLEMFLSISFKNGNSLYPIEYALLGSFDRDESGDIDGDNSLLKRILYFTDALGWKGGVNKKGAWVDEEDKLIEDISGYLNLNHTKANYDVTTSTFDYYIFTYNKLNKKANKGYPTVCPKIVKNTPAGRKDLESYIQYMKANKFIVEHDSEDTKEGVSTASTTVSGTQTQF
jgi:hypothetical protein|tara:strand:+ start:1691 stop:2314 length:624 start_codon:yes stop_codon:yes gene_type:complete